MEPVRHDLPSKDVVERIYSSETRSPHSLAWTQFGNSATQTQDLSWPSYPPGSWPFLPHCDRMLVGAKPLACRALVLQFLGGDSA
jgi:hypothetical protein